VFLLLGIAGAVVPNRRGLFVGALAAVGMLMVLVGSYRSYHRISQERDELRARLEPVAPRFTIKAGVPYAGIPAAVNSLIIPDVHVVNWSNAPIDLRFTLLAADGSGSLGSDTRWSRASFGGTILPNPMHVDPHSSRGGRLAWIHHGGDLTQYLIAGVVLHVLDELSGLRIHIPLPTTSRGFDYPENVPAT
jgi:hypothetical protein